MKNYLRAESRNLSISYEGQTTEDRQKEKATYIFGQKLQLDQKRRATKLDILRKTKISHNAKIKRKREEVSVKIIKDRKCNAKKDFLDKNQFLLTSCWSSVFQGAVLEHKYC